MYDPQHVVAWLSRLALIVALRNDIPRILAALELAEACERLDAEADGVSIGKLLAPQMDGTRWAGLHTRAKGVRALNLSALIVALAGRA